MKTYTTLLFDLDGTLVDSGEGIMKSAAHALGCLGIPVTDFDSLRSFVGPPLVEQFMEYAGLDREKAMEATGYYRERYRVKGVFEVTPYPGILQMLARLKERGFRTGVASSKPEYFCRQILERYGMAEYLDEIVGATMDEKRTAKADVIREAISRLQITDAPGDALMIGDKSHDVLGARALQMDCVCIRYGYGTAPEIAQAQPAYTAATVAELERLLLGLFRT